MDVDSIVMGISLEGKIRESKLNIDDFRKIIDFLGSSKRGKELNNSFKSILNISLEELKTHLYDDIKDKTLILCLGLYGGISNANIIDAINKSITNGNDYHLYWLVHYIHHELYSCIKMIKKEDVKLFLKCLYTSELSDVLYIQPDDIDSLDELDTSDLYDIAKDDADGLLDLLSRKFSIVDPFKHYKIV